MEGGGGEVRLRGEHYRMFTTYPSRTSLTLSVRVDCKLLWQAYSPSEEHSS